MTTAHDYATEHADQFRTELHTLLKIPSISTDPQYAPEVKRAAEWLTELFQKIGLESELITIEGQHPLVYAEYMGAGKGAKTVLVYGHYDVQPAVMADGWDTPPFEPVEQNGKIYARGATDDKGQFFTHVKAVEALLKSDDTLPVNVKFIIEGEEEAGSRAMKQFVEEQGDKLAADVCVISDTSMAKIEQPVIINALRGGAIFELIVRGPAQDLHSGMYGGTVHNPLQALAEIITQLHNDDGSIAVPRFYDEVVELTKEDRDAIAKVPWDNIDWAEETGAPLAWGEADYTLRERVGARPTLEITGMAGGYHGDGFKNIVPAQAHAKISCRLVANQDPQKIASALLAYIQNIAPPTVQVELKFVGGAPAVLVDTDSPYMEAAVNAYANGWGATPVFKREGGSIPIVSDFQSKLGLPVILMGFGLNTDGLHGPNEHFSVEMFHKGIDTAIHFLQEVAVVQTASEVIEDNEE